MVLYCSALELMSEGSPSSPEGGKSHDERFPIRVVIVRMSKSRSRQLLIVERRRVCLYTHVASLPLPPTP